MEAEDERGGGDFGAAGLVRMLEHLVDGGDALFDGDGGATIFLDGAGAEGIGVAGEGDEWFDLIGLAAEAEEQDGCEVGMGGVADEDAAEKVCGFAVLGHAAASAMGDGYDVVDVGVGAEDLGGEVGGDATGYRGGAVDGCEDPDVVTSGDAAVGADDALKGRGRVEQFDGAGFGAYGVIALEVSGDEVVGVNQLTDGDGLRGKADDLIEFTDGFAWGDGMDGEFVAGGDVAERNHVHAVEGLACSERLEGDHDVVQGSEFESMEAQTVLSTPLLIWMRETESAQLVVRPHSTPS